MIKDLKDLKQIIKLCRASGVLVLKLGENELHLGPAPVKVKATPRFAETTPEGKLVIPKPNLIDEGPDRIDTPDELSEDQMLFYSAKEIEQ